MSEDFKVVSLITIILAGSLFAVLVADDVLRVEIIQPVSQAMVFPEDDFYNTSGEEELPLVGDIDAEAALQELLSFFSSDNGLSSPIAFEPSDGAEVGVAPQAGSNQKKEDCPCIGDENTNLKDLGSAGSICKLQEINKSGEVKPGGQTGTVTVKENSCYHVILGITFGVSDPKIKVKTEIEVDLQRENKMPECPDTVKIKGNFASGGWLFNLRKALDGKDDGNPVTVSDNNLGELVSIINHRPRELGSIDTFRIFRLPGPKKWPKEIDLLVVVKNGNDGDGSAIMQIEQEEGSTSPIFQGLISDCKKL